MTRKKVVLILLMTWLIAVASENSMSAEDKKSQHPAGAMQPFSTEICNLETREALLDNCVGKRVKIAGKMAKSILDPNFNYPDVSSIGGYTNQYHIDTQWGQLGLISQNSINCQEDIEIEGILRSASLVGENQQNSSKKLYIQVLVFHCK